MKKFHIFEEATKNGSILYLTQNTLKAMLFKGKNQNFEYWTLKKKKEIANFFYDFQLQEIEILDVIIL